MGICHSALVSLVAVAMASVKEGMAVEGKSLPIRSRLPAMAGGRWHRDSQPGRPVTVGKFCRAVLLLFTPSETKDWISASTRKKNTRIGIFTKTTKEKIKVVTTKAAMKRSLLEGGSMKHTIK